MVEYFIFMSFSHFCKFFSYKIAILIYLCMRSLDCKFVISCWFVTPRPVAVNLFYFVINYYISFYTCNFDNKFWSQWLILSRTVLCGLLGWLLRYVPEELNNLGPHSTLLRFLSVKIVNNQNREKFQHFFDFEWEKNKK